MAHYNPQNAIFSPSVARQAASTAKDWSFVDDWLRNKYKGRNVPQFERNSEILKALLALASHSEAVDEERDQLAQLEKDALAEIEATKAEKLKLRSRLESTVPVISGRLLADDILDAFEDGLSKEGRTALDAMARMALELGVMHPSPEILGAKFVELQALAFKMELMNERVEILQCFVDSESRRIEILVGELGGDRYKPESDMAKRNLELQREVKVLSTKLPELEQQAAVLTATVVAPTATVEDVKEDEEEYIDLLRRKTALDAQVRAFQGLPPNIETARVEMESLRNELRNITERRDAIFESLVERESPIRKPRRL